MINIDSKTIKSIATKGLRLQKYLTAYHCGEKGKKEVIQKFIYVWGDSLASHFLIKYDDAENMIWAFDRKNLDLFIEKF